MSDYTFSANLPKNFGKKGYVGNPHKVSINHPLASEMSFFKEPSSENFCEAAFFNKDKWVIATIPELSEYADVIATETRVYRYIPQDVLEKFISDFS